MKLSAIASLLIATILIAEPFIRKKHKNKRQRLRVRADMDAMIEGNPLPSRVDWNELNDFLSETQYGINMPDRYWFMLDWEIQPCVKEGNLSQKTVRVLQCLSRDMKYLFYDVYIPYDRCSTIEDKDYKYHIVKEVLDVKYTQLSQQMREKIYEQFQAAYKHR
ncbi:MAG: hypothetical protein K2J67_08325 [Lachnospiraceae bacterium]|nr:hypothetical protein [Lachnospiraceae bacterium]